jgi:hypothetical protein
MIAPRGIVTCVGFDDYLSLTLPRNMRFLSECLVVTTPDDERTKAVARSIPGVSIFETTAFTDHGAAFNKGLAMEQAFDHYGRTGWLLIHDADMLLPECTDFRSVQQGCLHGARRLLLEDAREWSPDFDWRKAKPYRDEPAVGYFQLFHADSMAIQGKRFWYDVTFAHAGGCDAYFLDLWPSRLLRRMPFDVLHLGPVATNWFQRVSSRLDGLPVEDAAKRLAIMNSFIKSADWFWARPGLKIDTLEVIPDTPHRVNVPGCNHDYEIPVIRNQGQRTRRIIHQ